MSAQDGARLLGRERAWSSLLTGRLGRPLYVFDELDSSLDTLARLVDEGAPEGCCVLAERQRRGRGRRGRVWESAAGSSLLLALHLKPGIEPEWAGLLSLGSALALVRAAARLGAKLDVKWPNDVWHKGRKLAGILLESRYSAASCVQMLLGVGINVHQGPEDFPAALRGSATSLDQILGRRVERGELLAAYLAELEGILAELEAGRGASVLEAWRKAWPHQGCRARDEKGRMLLLKEVNDRGELLVESDMGPEILRGGDLSVLPLD